jgi:hypothetical protein
MRSCNDSPLLIKEQDRSAVGSEDSKQQLWPIGNDRVRARSLVLGPGSIGKDDFCRVNLVHRDKLGAGKNGSDCPAAVLVDRGAVVTTSVTHVQALELAR